LLMMKSRRVWGREAPRGASDACLLRVDHRGSGFDAQLNVVLEVFEPSPVGHHKPSQAHRLETQLARNLLEVGRIALVDVDPQQPLLADRFQRSRGQIDILVAALCVVEITGDCHRVLTTRKTKKFGPVMVGQGRRASKGRAGASESG